MSHGGSAIVETHTMLAPEDQLQNESILEERGSALTLNPILYEGTVNQATYPGTSRLQLSDSDRLTVRVTRMFAYRGVVAIYEASGKGHPPSEVARVRTRPSNINCPLQYQTEPIRVPGEWEDCQVARVFSEVAAPAQIVDIQATVAVTCIEIATQGTRRTKRCHLARVRIRIPDPCSTRPGVQYLASESIHAVPSIECSAFSLPPPPPPLCTHLAHAVSGCTCSRNRPDR